MFSLSHVGTLVRQGPGRFIPRTVAVLGAFDVNIAHSRSRLSAADIALAVILGSVAFWSILALPVPWPEIGKVELWLAQSAFLALIVGLLAAVATDIVPARAGRVLAIAAASACIAAFALPLAVHWFHGTSNGGVIGGLIPYSDASGYMAGAWHLLAEGELNHWNMRRPINATLHAVRWVISGGDMMTSFALTAWLIGLGSLLAAAYVRRDLGWAAAVIFSVAWLLFVDEWLPLTLSESHGCLLGVIGFALIWQSAKNGCPLTFGFGMAIISMALAARAGPFFLLPALWVWGVLYLGHSLHGRIFQAAAGLLGLGLGQSVSRFFNMMWGDGVNSLYSNFSYTLYGMSAGGKQWNAVYNERPEIFQAGLGESRELAARIYQAAFDNFVANPELLLGFLGRELARFPRFLVDWPMLPMQVGDLWSWLMIAGCLGMAVTWRKPLSGLLIAGLAGLWFSSPFLMLDGGHRVFAPGIPWIAAIVALGACTAINLMTFLARLLKSTVLPEDRRSARERFDGPHVSWWSSNGAAVIGGITILTVVAGPVLAIALYPRVDVEPSGLCPAGQTERIIRPAWSSIILQTVPDSTTGLIRAPEARHPAYFQDLPPNAIPFMTAVAEQTAPYALMQVYDLISPDAGRQSSVHAIRRDDVLALPEDGVVALCGTDLCLNCYLYDIRSWHRLADD